MLHLILIKRGIEEGSVPPSVELGLFVRQTKLQCEELGFIVLLYVLVQLLQEVQSDSIRPGGERYEEDKAELVTHQFVFSWVRLTKGLANQMRN